MKKLILMICLCSAGIVAIAQQNVGIGTSTPYSTLDVSGSVGTNILTISAAKTLDGTHHTIVATPSSAYTITLPAISTSINRIYTIIYNGTAGGNTITIQASGSDNIVVAGATGASTFTGFNGGTLTLQNNGTSWFASTVALLTGATGPTGATPYYNGTTWIYNSSNIYNNGANVGIGGVTGTTGPVAPLQVAVNGTGTLFNGALDILQPGLLAGSTGAVYVKLGVDITNGNDEADLVFNYLGGSGSASNNFGIGFQGSYPVANFYANGNVSVGSLAGIGDRPVYADSNGIIHAGTFGHIQISTTQKTFAYTGSDQTWTVPTGISQIYVKLWAAGGGGGNTIYGYAGPGGGGGFVCGLLNVTAGNTLYVVVGQGGATEATSGTGVTYGGGGAASLGGNGGGRSAIRLVASTSTGVDLVTAGGGGGGGTDDGTTKVASVSVGYGMGGGGGGGLSGVTNSVGASCGGGGTQTTGGVTGCNGCGNGNNGGTTSQYAGGVGCLCKWDGGGGGGWYGGGGGTNSNGNGPGGGGSSYTGNLSSPGIPLTNGTVTFGAIQNLTGGTYTTIGSLATVLPVSGGASDSDYGSTNTAGAGGLQKANGTSGQHGNNGYVIIYY